MRAFIALEVPARVTVGLDEALANLRSKLPPARWVPAPNRHLTLVFLGTVAAEDLTRLDDSLGPVFAAEVPFELELGHRGTFPAGRPGRVVWVGFRPSKALGRLQEAVAEACRSLDFDIERRPFSPHLTLARCRKPWSRRACEVWSSGPSGGAARSLRENAFTVDRGCLFESVPRERGVHYSVLRSYPLGMRTAETASATRDSQ